ncbi:MAG: YeeE/YedE family protein, partial [Deinococcus sp.]|nr:YeeE/YedE family protein [Deinococcus sp.]
MQAVANVNRESQERSLLAYWPFLLLGTFFGFVLIRSEVVSWYHIQEMFRFQSFHMYGVIGSAVIVG